MKVEADVTNALGVVATDGLSEIGVCLAAHMGLISQEDCDMAVAALDAKAGTATLLSSSSAPSCGLARRLSWPRAC